MYTETNAKVRRYPADPSKAERILRRLQDNVGGDFRISQRGVPYLFIGGPDGLSACYFKTGKFVRVFTGFGKFDEKRKRFDFKEWPQAKAFIQEQMGTDPFLGPPAPPAPPALMEEPLRPISRVRNW